VSFIYCVFQNSATEIQDQLHCYMLSYVCIFVLVCVYIVYAEMQPGLRKKIYRTVAL